MILALQSLSVLLMILSCIAIITASRIIVKHSTLIESQMVQYDKIVTAAQNVAREKVIVQMQHEKNMRNQEDGSKEA